MENILSLIKIKWAFHKMTYISGMLSLAHIYHEWHVDLPNESVNGVTEL